MITSLEIKDIYVKTFGVSWWQELFGMVKFCFGDLQYEDLDLEEVKKVVASDEIDKMKYEAEEYDCEDYAFALMGALHHNRKTAAMPIFITWVSMPEGGHAVLSVVTKDRRVLIIEPQNDSIYPVPNNWSLMLLCG